MEWMADQPFSKNARNLISSTKVKNDTEVCCKTPDSMTNPHLD